MRVLTKKGWWLNSWRVVQCFEDSLLSGVTVCEGTNDDLLFVSSSVKDNMSIGMALQWAHVALQ